MTIEYTELPPQPPVKKDLYKAKCNKCNIDIKCDEDHVRPGNAPIIKDTLFVNCPKCSHCCVATRIVPFSDKVGTAVLVIIGALLVTIATNTICFLLFIFGLILYEAMLKWWVG
jgi:hypothetical protein